MSIKNYKVAAALAIFCTLLWGTAFPFIKVGYAQFGIEGNDIGSKLLFAGARFTLAGIMVLFIFLVKNKHLPKIEKNGIMPVMLLGSVQTFGQYIFTYIGIGFTSGANTSVITACATFFTVLFAPLFFKSDKLNICKIIGCVLGFCGVLCVNSGGGVTVDTLFGDQQIHGAASGVVRQSDQGDEELRVFLESCGVFAQFVLARLVNVCCPQGEIDVVFVIDCV